MHSYSTDLSNCERRLCRFRALGILPQSALWKKITKGMMYAFIVSRYLSLRKNEVNKAGCTFIRAARLVCCMMD